MNAAVSEEVVLIDVMSKISRPGDLIAGARGYYRGPGNGTVSKRVIDLGVSRRKLPHHTTPPRSVRAPGDQRAEEQRFLHVCEFARPGL